jgi:hypothetical protein
VIKKPEWLRENLSSEEKVLSKNEMKGMISKMWQLWEIQDAYKILKLDLKTSVT